MNRLAVIIILATLSGCAPHSPTVPTQTNADRHWPAPRNPPVMVFTNAPVAPAPMRAVAQSMKAFVAVPKTNSPHVQHWINFMAANCPGQTLTNPADLGADQRQACGCNSNAYYAGMARTNIPLTFLGVNPENYAAGYLNIPIVIQGTTNFKDWFYVGWTTNGRFNAPIVPFVGSEHFRAMQNISNVNLIK